MCANERCDDYVCYTGYEKTDDICKDIDECDTNYVTTAADASVDSGHNCIGMFSK